MYDWEGYGPIFSTFQQSKKNPTITIDPSVSLQVWDRTQDANTTWRYGGQESYLWNMVRVIGALIQMAEYVS